MKVPEGYYLIADPKSGAVVRRSHKYAGDSEPHLVFLWVNRKIWNTYRVGDMVMFHELPPAEAARWLRIREETLK